MNIKTPADSLLWDETFTAKVEHERGVRKKNCNEAKAVITCPVCKAEPGKPCGYVALDAHFGEDLPDEWVHFERRKVLTTQREAEAAAKKKAEHDKAAAAAADML